MTESSGQISVVCKVCGTRMSADVDQVGSVLVCPDCYTKNRVENPKKEPPQKSVVDDDDFEYKLAKGSDQPSVETDPTVALICTTCHTLLHAPEKDIGNKIQCHDCDGWNVVPRPQKTSKVNAPALDPTANMPIGEAALTADKNRQNFAQRMLDEAHEELQRIEDEKPQLIDQKTPLLNGILLFPFYPSVLPVWAGLAIGMMLVTAMVEAINFFMESGGHAMIFSAAIAALGGMVAITLIGSFSTKLLAVVEYTSSGRIDIDEWPQSDLLERAFALILILNALALSFLPEIFFGDSLGIRGLIGGITATLAFPVLLLSLLDSGSLWIPFSQVVYGSITKIRSKWILFWISSFVIIVATLAVSFVLSYLNHILFRIFVASIVNSFSIIVYARMLGWMGWHIGSIQLDVEEEDDGDSWED